MGRNHSPRIITDGLVLCLDAANIKSYSGSGNTVINLVQSSSSANLVGGAYVSNNVFVLDGTDDTITVSNFELRRNHTISCWIRPETFSFFMLGHGTDGFSSAALHVFLTTTTIEYRMWANDFSASVSPIANAWYNFTFTYQHTSPYTRNIYLNGELIGTYDGSQYVGTGNFRFGALYSSGGTEYGQGNFGPVSIYSRILSAEEIKQNFNALRGRFGI